MSMRIMFIVLPAITVAKRFGKSKVMDISYFGDALTNACTTSILVPTAQKAPGQRTSGVMKKMFFIILVTVYFTSCKKSAPACGYACSCINTKNELYFGDSADSDSVYNRVLGTWYMQQEETWNAGSSCNRTCYCNSQYAFIVLTNKTIIRSMPGNHKDTIGYTFPLLSDTSNMVMTNGIYYTVPDSVLLGNIYYNGSFLYLSTLNQYYNTNIYSNTQYDYFLTR